MIYTPTNNQIATYGEKSSANATLQNAINTVSPNKIAVDSMYGDQTKGAYDSLIKSGYTYANGAFTKTPATPNPTVTPNPNIGKTGRMDYSDPTKPNGVWIAVDPATGLDKTSATDTGRYARTTNPNDSLIKDMETKLFDANNLSAPDLETIRADKRKQAELMVDSIRAEFARTLDAQGVTNAGLNDRVRALNVGAGLGGSDFATASAIGQEKKNQKAIDMIESEKASKIAAVYADVDQRATEQYTKEREAYVKGLGDNLTALKTARDEDRAKATNTIKGFASAGVNIEKLKQTDPTTYDMLLKEYGGSQLDLETAWNASLPDNMKTQYGQITKQGTNGNAVIMRYGLNPVTGKTETKEYDMGIKYGDFIGKGEPELKEIDGRLWSVTKDANGNQVATPLTETSALTKSIIAKNYADANKQNTPTPSFSFNGSQKTKLINANFKDADITNIQNDIRTSGINAVLANPSLTEAQKTAIKDSLKGSAFDEWAMAQTTN